MKYQYERIQFAIQNWAEKPPDELPKELRNWVETAFLFSWDNLESG